MKERGDDSEADSPTPAQDIEPSSEQDGQEHFESGYREESLSFLTVIGRQSETPQFLNSPAESGRQREKSEEKRRTGGMR